MSRKHPGCVTDPLTRQWWREYQHVMEGGNPLGMSFVEYVSARLAALGPRYVYASDTAPQYIASCAHMHPWGEPCTVLST